MHATRAGTARQRRRPTRAGPRRGRRTGGLPRRARAESRILAQRCARAPLTEGQDRWVSAGTGGVACARAGEAVDRRRHGPRAACACAHRQQRRLYTQGGPAACASACRQQRWLYMQGGPACTSSRPCPCPCLEQVLRRSACRPSVRQPVKLRRRAGAVRGGAGRRHAGVLCGAARALC